jgi:hypothetical protein
LLRDNLHHLIGIHCGYDHEDRAYFATGINRKALEWIKHVASVRSNKDSKRVELEYKYSQQ